MKNVDPSKLRQATLLAQPFDPSLIDRKPGGKGAAYVSHPVVQQRFMFVTGAPKTEVREILRGLCKNEKLGLVVVGVVMRMEVLVDGDLKVAEEAGSCEHPQNESHDGERLKKACSDAYKRCAMRCAGVGLHLWCKGAYTLGDRMIAQDLKERSELVESAAHEEDEPVEGQAPATPTEARNPPGPAPDRFVALKVATASLPDPEPVVAWVKAQHITRGSLTDELAAEWQDRIDQAGAPGPVPAGEDPF